METAIRDPRREFAAPGQAKPRGRAPIDVYVNISFDHRRGLWAAETSWTADKGRITKRQAGSLPTQAHPHTLQSVAIIAGLKIVPRRAQERIMEQTRLPKLRVKITTLDATFAQARILPSKANESQAPLKAAVQFAEQLRKYLYRFAFSVKQEPDNPSLLNLKEWARNSIVPPSKISSFERVFGASAVAE